MLTVRISGNGLGAIQDRLRGITTRRRDVATAGEDALTAGIRADALAAIDRYGQRMPPRKKPRPDGARGPVVSPHYTASRRIANFRTRFVNRLNGWEITAGWTGDVKFMDYLAEKGRDVRGPSPETRRKVVDAVRAAFRRVLR